MDRRQLASDCARVIAGHGHKFEQLDDLLTSIVNRVAKKLKISLKTYSLGRYQLDRTLCYFVIFFIYEHSCNGLSPNKQEIERAVDLFIEFKEKNRDLTLISIKGGQLKSATVEEFLNFQHDDPIEDRFNRVHRAIFDRCVSGAIHQDSIIWTIDHPQTPWGANASSVSRLVDDLIDEKIQVALVRGAYRYQDGHLTEEISFRGYYDNKRQYTVMLKFAQLAFQESVLLISKNGETKSLNLATKEISFLGIWSPIAARKVKDLGPNDGFSIIDGQYYGISPTPFEQVA